MLEPVYQNLSREEVDAYSLVLSASGLRFKVKKSGRSWGLWVEEAVHDRARYVIEQYIAENPEPQFYQKTERPLPVRISMITVSLIMIGVHVAVTYCFEFQRVVERYGASAYDILNGDACRTVTALMLHSNVLHLISNIAGLAVFATPVCTIIGPGVGWLMILLSGILGNLANAIFFQSYHSSIGASTAVFGTVGILSAHQFTIKSQRTFFRKDAWLSLGGGIALLGFLGAGEHTDITAHFFGFIAGIFLGFLYAYQRWKFMKKKNIQIYAASITIGIIIFSWL